MDDYKVWFQLAVFGLALAALLYCFASDVFLKARRALARRRARFSPTVPEPHHRVRRPRYIHHPRRITRPGVRDDADRAPGLFVMPGVYGGDSDAAGFDCGAGGGD